MLKSLPSIMMTSSKFETSFPVFVDANYELRRFGLSKPMQVCHVITGMQMQVTIVHSGIFGSLTQQEDLPSQKTKRANHLAEVPRSSFS